MKEMINENKNVYFDFKDKLPLYVDNVVIKVINVDELMYLKTNNDFDQYLMSCRPVIKRNDEESKMLFNQIINNEKNMLLGVYLDDDYKEVIGRISFYDINVRNKSIELGYLMAHKYQGKGLMSKALKKVIDVMFEYTEINKIYAQTAEFNERSCHLLESCGFVLDGKLREHHEYNGKLYNDLIYSILKSDYKNGRL